jgi:hypothetical protein
LLQKGKWIKPFKRHINSMNEPALKKALQESKNKTLNVLKEDRVKPPRSNSF